MILPSKRSAAGEGDHGVVGGATPHAAPGSAPSTLLRRFPSFARTRASLHPRERGRIQ